MRRALGKGLAQLLGEQGESQVTELPIDSIEPNPDQPRTVFEEDALQELAESIRQVGILQPIVVRPTSDGRYSLIAGERRWRAAQLAGLSDVPVVVRHADERTVLQLAIIENVQREDITSIEQAVAYKRLIDEFSLTQDAVASGVGKSRAAVANTLRLLRLPKEVQDAIGDKLITEGHARALLMCASTEQTLMLFYKIVDEGLTVRETERLARKLVEQGDTEKKKKVKVALDPNWRAAQDSLSEFFGTPTSLHRTEKGGSIQIQFFSDEDLTRILELLDI